MVKKKVCKKCKLFVTENKCPLCHGESFTTNFQGRVFVMDSKKSVIADKIGAEAKGEYAIKIK